MYKCATRLHACTILIPPSRHNTFVPSMQLFTKMIIMKSLNKVQLIGYLGKDPEIITMKDGTLMAGISMATDQYFQQKDGEPKKYTDWHTVKLWDQKQVEKMRNYLIKGSHILVDGRILYRTYTDKKGHTRYVTEI